MVLPKKPLPTMPTEKAGLDQEAMGLAQQGMKKAPMVPASNMRAPAPKKVVRMGLSYPGMTPAPTPAPQPQQMGAPPKPMGGTSTAAGLMNSKDQLAAKNAATRMQGGSQSTGQSATQPTGQATGFTSINVTGPNTSKQLIDDGRGWSMDLRRGNPWYGDAEAREEVNEASQDGGVLDNGVDDDTARDEVAGAQQDAAQQNEDDLFEKLMAEFLGSGPRDTSEEEAVTREEIQRGLGQNTADLMAGMGAAGFGNSNAQLGMVGDMNSQAAFNASKRVQDIRQQARDEHLKKAGMGIDAYMADRGMDMTEDQYGRMLDILENYYTPGDVLGDSNGDGEVDMHIDDNWTPWDPSDDTAIPNGEGENQGVQMIDPDGNTIIVPKSNVWMYELQGWTRK